MTMNNTMTVGMDLADNQSELCFLDGAGRVKTQRQIPTTKAAISQTFRGKARLCVVMEVGPQSPWISRLVSDLGHDVVVANARRVQLISKNIKKCDATDAEILARLGRADRALLAPITHRREATQQDRAQLRSRATLVAARTKLINSVRGQAKAFGYSLKKCSAERFSKLALPESLEAIFRPMLESIGQLSEAIDLYDTQIAALSRTHYPESQILETVYGVGTTTAVAYIATLEDPQRYKNGRAVAAYLGLTPRRKQTGNKDPELGISKAGDAYLRGLLVQAAQRILGPFGPDSALRQWGLKLCERGGKGAKKKAVIAVARKLSGLLFVLWQTGRSYEPFPAHM